MLARQAIEPLDGGVQELGVDWKRDVLRLNRGIDSDPSEVFGAQCAAFVRDTQALGQEQFELLSEPLAPMAQVRTLVRKLVLEEFRTGEVLEIGIVNPALTYRFVGQRKDVLEQEQPDDETSLDPGAALVAVKRRDLAIEPLPIDLA